MMFLFRQLSTFETEKMIVENFLEIDDHKKWDGMSAIFSVMTLDVLSTVFQLLTDSDC